MHIKVGRKRGIIQGKVRERGLIVQVPVGQDKEFRFSSKCSGTPLKCFKQGIGIVCLTHNFQRESGCEQRINHREVKSRSRETSQEAIGYIWIHRTGNNTMNSMGRCPLIAHHQIVVSIWDIQASPCFSNYQLMAGLPLYLLPPHPNYSEAKTRYHFNL